jgi:protoporphyrinogen IX oxidase
VTGFLTAAYPWIKALHIVSIVAWMAGLLYLPRLFVYHAEARPGADAAETFKIMERRLLRGIMNPAMIAAILFGALLAATPGVVDWRQGWIWTKLGLVIALVGFHHALARWRKQFAENAPPHTARFFRMANELPMLVLIAIVIPVVVRPF